MHAGHRVPNRLAPASGPPPAPGAQNRGVAPPSGIMSTMLAAVDVVRNPDDQRPLRTPRPRTPASCRTCRRLDAPGHAGTVLGDLVSAPRLFTGNTWTWPWSGGRPVLRRDAHGQPGGACPPPWSSKGQPVPEQVTRFGAAGHPGVSWVRLGPGVSVVPLELNSCTAPALPSEPTSSPGTPTASRLVVAHLPGVQTPAEPVTRLSRPGDAGRVLVVGNAALGRSSK